MKKYLLTALLGVFGFVGAFASAESITFNYSMEIMDYSPISYNNPSDVQLSISDFTCSARFEGCVLILSDDNTNYFINLYYGVGDGKFTFSDSLNESPVIYDSSDDLVFTLPSGNYNVSSNGYEGFRNIVFDDSSSSQGGAGTGGTLLPNGTDDLEGIVNGLKSTIAEFIPYVAYIGIGIIVACLGFVAIRRLVNWVRAKIFDNF